jgi:segregation and condensation protein A
MKVRLDIFEGPLDLLLYVIKKSHVDISDIPISVVIEQYLEFLELMKILDINLASEYMVMAATLINIKSKMLLPQEKPEEQPEEDPREELVRKLLEYEKFKEAATYLKEKEHQRLKYVARPTVEYTDEVYFEASIFDLISAFKTALKEVPKDMFLEVIKDEFTIEEKMHDLVHLLVHKKRIPLEEIFSSARSKLEIIVIFLSILELIKLKEIIAIQQELFSSVMVVRREDMYAEEPQNSTIPDEASLVQPEVEEKDDQTEAAVGQGLTESPELGESPEPEPKVEKSIVQPPMPEVMANAETQSEVETEQRETETQDENKEDE